MSSSLRHIAIVGRGVAAYMSAACLSRALAGLGVRISVLEWGTAEPRSGPAGLGLAPLRAFHALMGLNDADVAGFARAMPCLGTRLSGFGLVGAPADFMLSFGNSGYAMDGIGFRHLHRGLGGSEPLEAYNLAATAARAGRFAWPKSEGASVMSSFTYGLNLDLEAYASGLRSLAQANGVVMVAGAARPEVSRTSSGRVEAISSGGHTLEADFFIDATGPSALLLRQALRVSFVRVTRLPANRMLAARSPRALPAAMNLSDAVRGGYFTQIGLIGGQAVSLTYEADQMDDERALRLFTSRFGVNPDTDLSFEQGRLSEAWVGNCVAVGAAAGMIEGLCASNLHAIQVSLTRLLSLFPSRGDEPTMRAEYNRLIAQSFDRQRDFAMTPYAVHDPEGDWPLSLRRKLEQFKSRGRVVLYDEETFSEEDWTQMFSGLGLIADRVDPRVYALDANRVRTGLEDMRHKVEAAVGAMPRLIDLVGGGRV